MSEEVTLKVNKRDLFGKKVKQLRRNGQIPAVVHERGKDSVHITVDSADFKKVFASAGRHHAIKLNIGGKKYTTIIKEVVNQPASAKFYHAVFQAIKEDEAVTAEIPLKITGEIPAERAGLLVLKNVESVEVEALPADLIDVVEVDGTKLVEVGDKLHISDITVPSSITIKAEPEKVVAAVEMPKDQIAEADAALEEMKAQEEAGEEPAEGEEAEEGAEEEGAAEGEAAKVPSEHGKEDDKVSEGEIRPGGKKGFEDKSQGHNPTKK